MSGEVGGDVLAGVRCRFDEGRRQPLRGIYILTKDRGKGEQKLDNHENHDKTSFICKFKQITVSQKLVNDGTQLFSLGISRNNSSGNSSSTILRTLGEFKPGGGGGDDGRNMDFPATPCPRARIKYPVRANPSLRHGFPGVRGIHVI